MENCSYYFVKHGYCSNKVARLYTDVSNITSPKIKQLALGYLQAILSRKMSITLNFGLFLVD